MATETKRYTLVADDITAKKATVTPTNAPAHGTAFAEKIQGDTLGYKRCQTVPRVTLVVGVTLEIHLRLEDRAGDIVWWTSEDA